MTPIDVILDACELRRLAPLVDVRATHRRLVDFKLGPILCTSRPPRLYLSWDGERAAWLRRVRALCPSPVVDRFLSEVPLACRRMIDTDGERTELYLDDLHEHGFPEMCRVLTWPDLSRSRLVETAETGDTTETEDAAETGDTAETGVTAETGRCPPTLEPLLAPFIALGGKLAIREGYPQPRAIWVSEARWNGSVGQAAALLRHRLPPGFETLRRGLAPFGLVPYVDALDAWDGGLDVTVGLLPQTGATAEATTGANPRSSP